MPITQAQLESIQIDYGLIYVNYGLAGERKLGPTRGGGSFKATGTIRDIEFDGSRGKSKNAQVIEDINASLSVTVLDTTMATLALAMPYATYDSSAGTITAKVANVGIIPTSAYLTNVVLFAKTISGQYKKITLYSAMSEGDFSFEAKPKGEAEIGLEFTAHWDALDDTKDLFLVEDVANISGDVTAPTVVTVPADAATGIVVTANLTATFSEDVQAIDINSNNFILMKAADGSVVAGTLTYANKVATFVPAASLSALTPYILVISNVRDTSGNKMAVSVTNFTTA